MRKLYYLVMISLASILIACENRSEEWDVVDFGNDCTVGLQEHLECRFIPLETKDSVLLKDLYRVCWVDDRIFVFDRSDEINALFVFSDQGNFITRVGLRGQGPEEYLYLTHFFVDEKERILTLVDFGGTALLRYDLDTYQYISTQDVADYFVDCAPLDKENWIWYYPLGFATPQRENFYLKATDRKGEQDALLGPAYFTSGHTINGSKTLHAFAGNWYAHFHFTPEVWKVKDGMLEPAYKVRFGDKSMPPIEYVKEKGRGGRDFSGDLFRSGYVNSFGLLETEQILHATYMCDKVTYFGFYDKDRKEAFSYAFPNFIRATGLAGFYGICGVYKDYFIGKISSTVLLRNQIHYEDLRRIAENRTQDDNPILCLFKIERS